MPDGDMRRPPLLWEQRLARRVTALGPGVSSSAATNVVEDFATSTGYDEPADTITTLGTPSTPTVEGTLKGVAVTWDGEDTDGDPYNAENQWVEVHVSDSDGFTPGTATKKGTLYEAGTWVVTPLTSGTTYYASLVGYDSEGNASAASAQGSAAPGLVISSDIGTGAVGTAQVSFNAREVGGITQTVGTAEPTGALEGDTWINTTDGSYNYFNGSSWVTQAWGANSIGGSAITETKISSSAITTPKLAAGAVTATAIAAGAVTATQIAAGAVIADKIGASAVTTAKLQAGAITADKIATGTITADKLAVSFLTATDVGSGGSTTIDGGRITAGTITGRTVQTAATGDRVRMTGNGDSIDFISTAGTASIASANISGVAGITVDGIVDSSSQMIASSFRPESNTIVFQGYRTTSTGADVMLRLNSNHSTTDEAKFQVEADGDVLSRTNSYGGYSDARLKENIQPARTYLDDLRAVEVVTFNWIGSDQKLLGVTAQQVQQVFPSMVAEDTDGTLSVRYSVFVPMLLTAVQQLAQQVDDLTARIEALEG